MFFIPEVIQNSFKSAVNICEVNSTRRKLLLLTWIFKDHIKLWRTVWRDKKKRFVLYCVVGLLSFLLPCLQNTLANVTNATNQNVVRRIFYFSTFKIARGNKNVIKLDRHLYYNVLHFFLKMTDLILCSHLEFLTPGYLSDLRKVKCIIKNIQHFLYIL